MLQRIGPASIARENEVGGSWGQLDHLTHVERWGYVLFSAAIIAAASISVPNTDFPKIVSNGSCGKDFAGKNDYHFLSKTIFIAIDSVLSPSTTFVAKAFTGC